MGKLTQEQYRRYYSTNEEARDAFIARKQNGLSLSERVWRYTDEFKTEMEMGLDLGIRAGKPADQISRDLRQYLQHPDMLFRRVRDEHGILHLSKRAKAFHPGQGVYRSSYLNARRLAVTETNTAYRTADHERWQDMDFVVGIEIHLSGNHTCKGHDGKPHKFTDICDELAGRYPKDFKFTGWHPHCRCYATTILKTGEEMAADTQKLLKGESVSGESENEVKDVPENFKEWVSENEERMERAKVLPMFLNDNKNYLQQNIRFNKIELQTTEIIGSASLTMQEQNQLTSEIKLLGRKLDLFRKEYDVGFEKFNDGTLMEWRDGKLTISTTQHRLNDGSIFCPVTNLQSAFKKLKEGKTLDFNEEYAIECLFHENVHSKATGIHKITAGSIDEKIAETCTQLYARERYVRILKAFNVAPVNHEKIKYNGLGYATGCNRLRPLFAKDSKIQVGELINIANETESGHRILKKKLREMGLSENEIKDLLYRWFNA